jgi:hypothetical protein
MSHFSVLVIGPDPEKQLAPYDENTEVEPYKRRVDAEEVASMAKYYSLDATDLAALVPRLSEWDGRDGGVDDDGLFVWSTLNPQSKWDYWRIGGRWRGFLRLVPGGEGSLAELSYEWTFDGPCTENWTGLADQALRGAVDLSAIQANCWVGDEPHRTYAVVAEGAWKAKAEMGWFGVSHSEAMDDLSWVEWWDHLIGNLSDDTLLTVVDCHI